jgi:integrase
MKANLSNDAIVRNLPLKDKPYYCMSDDRNAKGFGVLVYPSGSMTFIFKYKIDGIQKLLKLGEYPKEKLTHLRTEYLKASLKLNDLRRGSADGVDPVAKIKAEKQQRIAAAEAHSEAFTVDDLIDEYLTKWAEKRKTIRSVYNDRRSLKKDVSPLWGKRKATDIRRRDAILLIEKVAERAPGQAGYLAKTCRKMFSFALQREIVETNPFAEMVLSIPELATVKRDRVLSADEVKTVWHGIDNGPGSPAAKSILKLILTTGQRPGEVCGMRESELDGNWWAIPAERMKKRKPHRVYLTPFALSLLPTDRVGDAVFRSEISRSETSSDSLTVGTLSYILKRAKYFGLPKFTPHDLRRTCRTFLAEIGIPREHAEAVLSHTMGGVEGTYNRHHYDQEKQLALEAWERKLNSIINDTEAAKVISITRKAA